MGPLFLKDGGELGGEKPPHTGGRFTCFPPTIFMILGPRSPPPMGGSKLWAAPPHHDMGEAMFMFIDGGEQTDSDGGNLTADGGEQLGADNGSPP